MEDRNASEIVVLDGAAPPESFNENSLRDVENSYRRSFGMKNLDEKVKKYI